MFTDLENLRSKPPDLTSFLEEERRLEKLLYNQNKPERQDDTVRVSTSLHRVVYLSMIHTESFFGSIVSSYAFFRLQIYENVNVPSQNVYVDDGGDSESSQYMRDILQVEEQSRCNQLKNKAAQNNIGNRKKCVKLRVTKVHC